ncbi:acyl carrier protein [Streptomyces carpaticus]|uniref:Acyl carrier protein n=2 Tax=Streptomyces TaxID=1883 RepID=A0A1I6R036_9ACTN|nr:MULTISPECIES: acyl carrier protein [Streptomyces]MCL7021159.1 acyl carrier protein [Vibrio vulnificus]UWM47898.1 acyl carrier protein [Streptomyces carpaticus]MCK1813972.1 acyl carrier protein [Streptomyces sp. XM4011]QKV67609.1 acyl carrier protein [Streptomyces harbinensis]SFS58056.1 acyl carrier protein [Streptomyces harbinensis]
MSEQSILTSVAGIVEEIGGVPAADVTPEKHLVDDLGIDSLALIEIAVAVGEEFRIELSDDELKELRTVQDVVLHIEKGLAAR